MFDLFLFTLNVEGGKFQSELPGLLATTAPKKCARPRSEDTLFILLSFTSSARMAQPALTELLQKAQNAYYAFSGTATSALKAAAEQVNTILVEHNLRVKAESDRYTALLSLAVVKREQVYIAQAGAAHAFVLGEDQVQDLWDDAGNNLRGLGLNRAVTVKYFTAGVKPGDSLVLCPQSPPLWTGKALLGTPQLTLESLRRRLLNQAGAELQAGVVRFQEGKGLLHRLRVRTGAPAGEVSAPALVQPQVEAAPTPPSGQAPAELELPKVESEEIVKETTAPESLPDDSVGEKEPEVAAQARVQPTRSFRPMVRPLGSAQAEAQAQASVGKEKGESFTKRLATLFLGAKKSRQRLGEGVRNVTSRVLPGKIAQKPTLSPAMMLFVAIAIPAMVVAIAATVYMKNGLAEQRQIYLAQAQQASDQAVLQADPVVRRSGLGDALAYLEQADQYGTSEESQILREQIQNRLDEMDGVSRLELFPALKDRLSVTSRITRVVTAGQDVYLMDASQNQVLHLKRISNDKQYRYELDKVFACPTSFSTMVDIFPITFENKENATVVSLDDAGRIIYCSTKHNEPTSSNLIAPETGWGKITAADLYQGTLFILDTGKDQAMVWRYVKDLDGYWGEPTPFFEVYVPTLDDVVDIAVYANYLYLLHGNGTITLCEYDSYGGGDSTCSKDPVSYKDVQGKFENSLFNFDQAVFQQLVAVNQPDPSLFLLDAQGPTVLRFGVEMDTLFGQLRPRVNPEYEQPAETVSAFAVTEELPRFILLVFGNQLYYAMLQ